MCLKWLSKLMLERLIDSNDKSIAFKAHLTTDVFFSLAVIIYSYDWRVEVAQRLPLCWLIV